MPQLLKNPFDKYLKPEEEYSLLDPEPQNQLTRQREKFNNVLEQSIANNRERVASQRKDLDTLLNRLPASVEEEMKSNPLMAAVIGRAAKVSAQETGKGQTFDEFFESRLNARTILANSVAALSAYQTGRQVVSLRDQLLQEYQDEQRTQMLRERMDMELIKLGAQFDNQLRSSVAQRNTQRILDINARRESIKEAEQETLELMGTQIENSQEISKEEKALELAEIQQAKALRDEIHNEIEALPEELQGEAYHYLSNPDLSIADQNRMVREKLPALRQEAAKLRRAKEIASQKPTLEEQVYFERAKQFSVEEMSMTDRGKAMDYAIKTGQAVPKFKDSRAMVNEQLDQVRKQLELRSLYLEVRGLFETDANGNPVIRSGQLVPKADAMQKARGVKDRFLGLINNAEASMGENAAARFLNVQSIQAARQFIRAFDPSAIRADELKSTEGTFINSAFTGEEAALAFHNMTAEGLINSQVKYTEMYGPGGLFNFKRTRSAQEVIEDLLYSERYQNDPFQLIEDLTLSGTRIVNR